MFRSNSPLGNDASSYMGSNQTNGFSTMDEASSQVSSLSRPSARSIYLQRKEYASSINKMLDGFQYRVEHLFTCELDGRELRNLADCVERLKLLDGMGRVWGQSMLLEVKGTNLLLTDIETNEELESVALSDVLELKAVLDSGVFTSLLTLSVQARRKNITTVFMFQCEDVRADFVQKALSQVLSRRGEDPGISNAGLMAGHVGRTNPRNAAKSSEPKEQKRAVTPVPQWTAPDYEEDDSIEPELFVPLEEGDEHDTMSTPRPYSELDRNVDILNHIVSDIEIFMGQIAAADAKNAKKKKKKKKTKGKAMDSMPPAAEFAACLQKIKFGFNLVAELKGNINNPSAPEFVHSLFASLAFVVSHCPEDLPPSIVAPLLTPQCLCLMSEEVSTEEEQLWQSLGDAWNIPRSKWPDDNEDILRYTLEFFDGWQPPEAFESVDPRDSVSRQESAHSQTSAKWTPPRSQQKARSSESTLLRPMCVMYDFVSRNNRELTVSKGEMVELLDMSKQWWKVRNRRGEEGYVPNNILDADDKQPFQQTGGSPVLTKKSKPAEVKAWLEDKGFSKITVRCLGVLSGSMLLGMAREELKTVCPEEGGRVFFQLQAVRSTMAADT